MSGLLVAAVAENIEQIIATLSQGEGAGAGRRPHRVRARASHGAARARRRDGRDRHHRRPHDAGRRRRAVGSRSSSACCRSTSRPPRTSTTRYLVEIRSSSRHSSIAPARPRPARGVRCAQPHPPGVSDLAARLRSTLAFFASRPTAAPLLASLRHGRGRRRRRRVAGARRPRSTRRFESSSVADVIAMSGAAARGRGRTQSRRHGRHRTRGGALMAAHSHLRSRAFPASTSCRDPRSRGASATSSRALWVWVVFGAIVVALLIIVAAFLSSGRPISGLPPSRHSTNAAADGDRRRSPR